jgi:signal transduction histidine kinase
VTFVTLATTGLSMLKTLLAYIPHGNTLDAAAWQKRHRLLLGLLLLHVPGLALLGLSLGQLPADIGWAIGPPLVCAIAAALVTQRRVASFFVTVGLTYCSAALVGLTDGSIEAHFHFFVMIGFIALYQDWVPFLWMIAFTVLSHGLGSALRTDLIFNHPSGQTNPWLWSMIHGAAVLAACGGVVVFWKTTEDEQRKTLALRAELSDAEINRRRFTADLLVNLARRNQSLLYRQLDVINQLEEQEEDPDALAELFRLDHLATRIRRNAESLLVLSGERPPRTWSRPVPLVDIVRAAIAETEDLDRVVFNVDERLAVFGHAVADITHLLAELVENAVRFSPPHTSVSIRTRPHTRDSGGHVLTVEDWGVGLLPDDLAAANQLLATPKEVDLSTSQRLGLHVVARLAERHDVQVSLTLTPGGGLTAVVVLPADLFTEGISEPEAEGEPADLGTTRPAAAADGAAPPRRSLNGERSGRARDGARDEAGGAARPNRRPNRREPLPQRRADAFPAPAGSPPLPADKSSLFTPEVTPQPRTRPQPAAAAPPRRPSPSPSPSPSPPSPSSSSASVEKTDGQQPRLLKRVPQSHLAPGLRPQEESGSEAATRWLKPNADQARAALSRYQASRKAARSLVEGDTTKGDEPVLGG